MGHEIHEPVLGIPFHLLFTFTSFLWCTAATMSLSSNTSDSFIAFGVPLTSFWYRGMWMGMNMKEENCRVYCQLIESSWLMLYINYIYVYIYIYIYIYIYSRKWNNASNGKLRNSPRSFSIELNNCTSQSIFGLDAKFRVLEVIILKHLIYY